MARKPSSVSDNLANDPEIAALLEPEADSTALTLTPDPIAEEKLLRVADIVADELLVPYLDGLIKQSIARKVSSVPGIEEILGKLRYPVPANLELLLA